MDIQFQVEHERADRRDFDVQNAAHRQRGRHRLERQRRRSGLPQDFGDGQGADFLRASHTYTPGTYTITLDRDGRGRQDGDRPDHRNGAVAMKLAVLILNHDIDRAVTERLVAERFVFTRLASSGGFLRKKNATLLVGVEDSRVDALVALLRTAAPEREQLVAADPATSLSAEAGLPEVQLGAAPLHVGGATLFVLPVERSERF
ncbi:MAG: cyclic-di-AMP receptor [Candidatus Andersenbacteria bacterium]